MKKYLKLFVVEIEIDEDQWFVLPKKQPLYKKGQRIMIPIQTSSSYHAEMKFENNYYFGQTAVALIKCTGVVLVYNGIRLCSRADKQWLILI